jgi:hypothetical protein
MSPTHDPYRSLDSENLGFHPLQITGRDVLDSAPMTTEPFPFPPASPRSVQSSSPQDPPWERQAIFCHCDRRGENMANTICAERGPTRGMERERRWIVRKLIFRSLQTSEPPTGL